MDHDIAAEYLRRIGVAEPVAPTVDALRELHLRHLRSVPFENLSIHLDEPIVLDEAALLNKVVRRRRGGFCYELNGAFAALLRWLGFRVTLLAASVYGEAGRLGPPFDHLALMVELDQRWLVDVGFGQHTSYPLRLDWSGPQHDPGGEFLVTSTSEGDIEVVRDGQPQYRLETRPRALADFGPTCWWQQTSPESNFTQRVTCSLATPDGRVTISGDRLIVTTNGERTESVLGSDQALLDAYRTHFGMDLTRVPALRGTRVAV